MQLVSHAVRCANSIAMIPSCRTTRVVAKETGSHEHTTHSAFTQRAEGGLVFFCFASYLCGRPTSRRQQLESRMLGRMVRFDSSKPCKAAHILVTALSRHVQRTHRQSTGVRTERARSSLPRFFTSAWPTDLADGKPKYAPIFESPTRARR